MPVTGQQRAWLRAYLAGDLEAARRVHAGATAPGAAAAMGALVHAAFVIAARRKFAPEWTHAEVTRFVAQVRRLLRQEPDVLNPVMAERELLSALGEKLTGHPGDVKSRGRAQFILLNALVQSLGLDDAGLVTLLGQAGRIADGLLEGGQRPG